MLTWLRDPGNALLFAVIAGLALLVGSFVVDAIRGWWIHRRMLRFFWKRLLANERYTKIQDLQIEFGFDARTHLWHLRGFASELTGFASEFASASKWSHR